MNDQLNRDKYSFGNVGRNISHNLSMLFAMTRSRPTIVAAVLTLNLYIFVFQFKAGYTDYYHLPDRFVVLSLTSIVQCLMASWYYWIILFLLTLSAISSAQSRHMIPKWYHQFLYDFAVLCMYGLLAWLTTSPNFMWTMFIYTGVAIYPWKSPKDSCAVILNATLVSFLNFILAFSIGHDYASKQINYLVLEHDAKSWVLIEVDDNRLIFAKFLREAKTVQTDFLLLDQSVVPKLALEKLGPLSVKMTNN